MKLYLRLKINRLVHEVRAIKEAERHHITKGRALLGRWRKRHKKDKPKPEMPAFVVRASQWADAVDVHVAQEAINSQYYKFWGLERYRKHTLRPALRHSHLALGFLKGKRYDQIEASGCYQLPNFDEVKRMVEKFSEEDIRVTRQRWAEWKDAAEKALAIGASSPVSTSSVAVSA